MSRYIDADNLIKKMQERYNDLLNKDGCYDNFTQGYGDALSTVENEPTADVQKVRRGKWIVDEDGGVVICSECGEEHMWNDFRPPYCDMCGAKMEYDEASNMNKL